MENNAWPSDNNLNKILERTIHISIADCYLDFVILSSLGFPYVHKVGNAGTKGSHSGQLKTISNKWGEYWVLDSCYPFLANLALLVGFKRSGTRPICGDTLLILGEPSKFKVNWCTNISQVQLSSISTCQVSLERKASDWNNPSAINTGNNVLLISYSHLPCQHCLPCVLCTDLP